MSLSSSSSSNNSNVRWLVTAGTVIATSAAALLIGKKIIQNKRKRTTVVITGGCGNLGIKLSNHLLTEYKNQYNIILIEHPDFYKPEVVPKNSACSVVLGDLKDGNDDVWRRSLIGADVLIHFSAVNPYLNATWDESAQSMSHSFNVYLAAIEYGVKRVIMASSNHVMGQYKDMIDDHNKIIHPTSKPQCGTFLHDKEQLAKTGDAIAYSAAKLAGEQLCHALAATTTKTTFIILRIGWCQPNENSPLTLSAAGVPPEYESQDNQDSSSNNINGETKSKEEEEEINKQHIDEEWFKNMWLSNKDYCNLFTAAINVTLPITGKASIVNAMSNNKGSRWSLKETKDILGYMPVDNSRLYV